MTAPGEVLEEVPSDRGSTPLVSTIQSILKSKNCGLRRSFCFLILDNVYKRDAQPAGVEVHRNAVSDRKFVEIFFVNGKL